MTEFVRITRIGNKDKGKEEEEEEEEEEDISSNDTGTSTANWILWRLWLSQRDFFSFPPPPKYDGYYPANSSSFKDAQTYDWRATKNGFDYAIAAVTWLIP